MIPYDFESEINEWLLDKMSKLYFDWTTSKAIEYLAYVLNGGERDYITIGEAAETAFCLDDKGNFDDKNTIDPEWNPSCFGMYSNQDNSCVICPRKLICSKSPKGNEGVEEEHNKDKGKNENEVKDEGIDWDDNEPLIEW